ncbi:hypothetical protein D1007_13990 [Hordeum vulgare]|nr:hypothetical protein D1007_13990 [Hordeum vulgare]
MDEFGRRKCFGHHRQSAGTTEGFRRPIGRGHQPQEATWAKCERELAPGWAGAPPTPNPWRLRGGRGDPSAGGRKAHQGVRHPLLPSSSPPISPSRAAAPPQGGNPEGGATLPSPIYSGVFGHWRHGFPSFHRRSPVPLLPPLPRCLAKPCRETLSLHRHHAIVLLEIFPDLFLLLAGSRCRRRHRAARVLNAEVPWFGTRSESHRDLNRREYDSINRVLATLSLSDLQRYEDALFPLSLLVSP